LTNGYQKLTKSEKLELVALQDEKDKRQARKNLKSFIDYTFPGMQWTEFHTVYCELLNKFAEGEIKKLIISVPPQHGKSEQSTRRLPAYIMGKNPDLKLAIGCYSSTPARKFGRNIKQIMREKTYTDVFGKRLPGNEDRGIVNQSEEIEMVGGSGSLKLVGRGSALTSLQVDVMIMDDLYKDSMEANSPVIRDNVYDWYVDVVKSRLHNDSQELIVFTRWNEDDLIGRLEAQGKVKEIKSLTDLHTVPDDTFIKINYEAIKESEKTEIDHRELNEALWPEKHNLKLLQEKRDLDEMRFSCLYQGNPVNKEGLLYRDFETYNKLPEHKGMNNYTDTADTGKDFLSSGVWCKGIDGKIYLADLLYTQEQMEQTEPATAALLDKNRVNTAVVESNNGGRGFARNVDSQLKGNTYIRWFAQTNNKESRIHTHSADVNRIVMPYDWVLKWPVFASHVKMYKRDFRANRHDDAPDMLTGIVETAERV